MVASYGLQIGILLKTRFLLSCPIIRSSLIAINMYSVWELD